MRHLVIFSMISSICFSGLATGHFVKTNQSRHQIHRKNPAQEQQNFHLRNFRKKHQKASKKLISLPSSSIVLGNKWSHQFLLILLLSSVVVDAAKGAHPLSHTVRATDIADSPGQLELLPNIPNGETIADIVGLDHLCSKKDIRIIFQEELAYISPSAPFKYLATAPLKPCQGIVLTWGNHSLLWHHSHLSCLDSLDAIYNDMKTRFNLSESDQLLATIYSSSDGNILAENDKIWQYYARRGLPTEQKALMMALEERVSTSLKLEKNQVQVILGDFHESGLAVDQNGKIYNAHFPHVDPREHSSYLTRFVWQSALTESFKKLPKNFFRCNPPYDAPDAIILEHEHSSFEACKEFFMLSWMDELIGEFIDSF